MTAWSAPVSRAGNTVFSSPSQLVDNAGNIYAAWQGPGHSLYEFVRYASDGSWNGPYNLVNTPNITYWAPTQIYNKTTGRITISMQGTNNKLVTLINGTAWTKLDTQISNNVSTGDKYWPTSAQYGGEDGHVNTSAEADAVAAAYQGASTEAAARQLMADLDPADLPLVEFSLRNSIHDGDLVANLDNSKIYLFANYKLHYLDYSIGHDILHADAEMVAAKRMTTGSLSTITEGDAVGPYKTSWDYGGTDRIINTTDDLNVTIDAASNVTSVAAATAFRDGLSPSDRALFDGAMDQVTPQAGVTTSDTIVPPNATERAALGSDPANDADATASAAAGYPKRGCRRSRDVSEFKASYGFLGKKTVATFGINGRFCWDRYKDTVYQSEPPHFDSAPINVSSWYADFGYGIAPGTAMAPQRTSCVFPCVFSYPTAFGPPYAVAMAIPFDVTLGYGSAAIPKYRGVDVIFGLESGQAAQHFFERPSNGIWHPGTS